MGRGEGTWRNWAGTESVTPARVVTPRTADEVSDVVRDAVRDGLRVKAVGSGHSFTGAAVAPGVQVRPHPEAGIMSLDRASGLVTVEAGMPLHRLNPELARHGLALEILGDIDRQTVAGAVSTGTHGSSRLFGSLSTQIRGVELVTADGSVTTVSAEQLPAVALSLGALGVITTVTLQCVPLYALRARDAKEPLDDVLADLETHVASNDHFEFFWFPHTTTALTRRFERLPAGVALDPVSSSARWFDDHVVMNLGFEALLRVGTRVPGRVPAITRFVTRTLSDREFTDLAPRVFSSARNVRFREGEYAVPREALVDVLTELRTWVETHDEPVSFPFEVRFVKADDLWLSPAYERDVAYVAFHQYHRMPHQRWFEVCEDVLGAAGGRPHWGKMHRFTRDDFAARVPRFADFVALRAGLDPGGVFANAYLDRVLGPVA